MSKLLLAAAGLELALGLILMIDPGIVTQLLLGEDLPGVGIALGRVAGFGFVAFGLACLPPRNVTSAAPRPLQALLTYNVLVTLYLVWLGIGGSMAGVLLWPVAATHAILTFLLARAYIQKS
jgi:hypothetical protein